LDTVGELVIPIVAGVITESDVLADLYDLVGGRHPGRRDPEEITLFKNGGGGHLDLMTARFVVGDIQSS
jgi:ornithine cyclodeaminase